MASHLLGTYATKTSGAVKVWKRSSTSVNWLQGKGKGVSASFLRRGDRARGSEGALGQLGRQPAGHACGLVSIGIRCSALQCYHS
jgi:hypothetical protein